MVSWLVDNSGSICLALGAILLGLLGLLWIKQERKYLIAVAVAGLAMALFWLLGTLVDTDSKRLERAIRTMAAGVVERNTDKVFALISDQFRHETWDKRGFRQQVERRIQSGDVTSIAIYNFEVRELSREDQKAMVTFTVKPRAVDVREGTWYNAKALFVLEPNDQWRMVGFDLYMPTVDPMSGQPLPIPY
jgi:hypothetical protein